MVDKTEKQNYFEAVDIKKTEENWSKYTLVDGTILRVKPVIVEVIRMIDQYEPNGDPIYQAKTALVIDATVPSRLKKPKSKEHELEKQLPRIERAFEKLSQSSDKDHKNR